MKEAAMRSVPASFWVWKQAGDARGRGAARVQPSATSRRLHIGRDRGRPGCCRSAREQREQSGVLGLRQYSVWGGIEE